jgi:hypothetical protein
MRFRDGSDAHFGCVPHIGHQGVDAEQYRAACRDDSSIQRADTPNVPPCRQASFRNSLSFSGDGGPRLCVVSWVWLNPAQVEFGEPPAGDGAERTIWLHADPYTVLDVPWGSDRDSLRRAFRRSARVRHPDAAAAEGSFEELQRALSVALGEDDGELTVEPTAGSWWSFCEFVRPADARPGRDAVAGLVFEVHDLDAVPLRRAEDTVQVTYGGQTLPLALCYSGSATARPVLIAKTTSLLESAVLGVICLALIPLIALLLSLESYFLFDGNVPLFWTILVGTVALGYGALALSLASAGKPIPYPRRAIGRLRGNRLVRPRLPSSRN